MATSSKFFKNPNIMKNEQFSHYESSKTRKDQEVLREIISLEKANINDMLSEEYKSIRLLWNDLGVTDYYRFVFESVVVELSPKERTGFLEQEITSLEKTSSDLKKLTKDIKTREKILVLLRHFEEILLESEINSKLANDILFACKNLRAISISIVKSFVSLREFNYFNHIKYDYENINKKKFFFERNYLIKMRSDTSFLSEGSLARYFHFSRESDPFLLSLSENHDVGTKVKEDHLLNKFYLQINNDTLATTKLLQHEIISEIILYEISSKASKAQKLTVPTLTLKKNIEEIKLIKSNNVGHDYKQAAHSIQNEINKKLIYEDNISLMKMNNQYINIDKEINLLKKEFVDNMEGDIIESQMKENLAHTIGGKKNASEEHPFSDSPQLTKSLKQQKTNQKIKIVIDDKFNQQLNEGVNIASDKAKGASRKSNAPETISIEGFDYEFLREVINTEIEQFFSSIPESQKVIFNLVPSMNVFKGIFPKFIRITKTGGTVGYLAYYNDPSSSSSLKICLSHISCRMKEVNELEEFLLSIKSFLLQKVAFDEAYISLHHYTDKDGKFLIDQEISDVLKKKLLFRWYTVQNTGNSQRITVLCLKNNNQIENPLKVNYLEKCVHSLRIKCSSTFKIKKNVTKAPSLNFKEMNIFPVLVNLTKREDESFLKIEKMAGFEPQLLRNKRCNFVSSIEDSTENTIGHLKAAGVEIEKSDLKYNHKKMSSALLMMKLKFENILTLKIKLDRKDFLYNLITVERIESLKHRETGQIFYLVRIDDNNSLIISDVSKMKLDKNLCEDFFSTYSKLEPYSDVKARNKVALPCFKKSVKHFCETPEVLKDLKIMKRGVEAKVSELFEYNEIIFENDADYENGAKLGDLSEILLIKDDFLLGLINFDVLDETQVPTVYMNVIEKGYWKEVKA